jgi:6,7-dimethyl-8-ribityllumazine synthase
LNAAGKRFAIVVTRWNALVSDKLREGAVEALVRHGVFEDDIEVFISPGSFEIPIICQKIAKEGKFQAIITVGALLDGETDHYRWVGQALVSGLNSVSLEFGIPVTFGIVTSGDFDAALQRAGGKAGNKGEEAAVAAIEALSLIDQIGG